MQISHIKYLRCTNCGNSLVLIKGYIRDKKRVKAGILGCKGCGMQFPIIRFVPRLLEGEVLKECLSYYLPSDIKSNLPLHHFYKELFSKKNFKLSWTEAKKIQTLRSFGYEWTKWSKLPDFAENLFFQIMNKKRNFFHGKIGWDPACGMGKDLYNAAISVGSKGFMIGSDISYAVDSAYERCKRLKNVLIIQADLYSNFIRDNSMDFAYMIGLVQHLTTPSLGTEVVLKKVKKNGYFVATVYHQAEDLLGKLLLGFISFMRIFTLHLPYNFVLIICRILALIPYIFFRLPYFILKRFTYIKGLTEMYPSEKVKLRRPDLNYFTCNWFDHLTTPIINFYSDEEIRRIFRNKYLHLFEYRSGFIRGIRV